MVINNVRALLLITYRISLQNHVRVSPVTEYRKLLLLLSVFSFGHEEKPLEQKKSTLPAANRWHWWSHAAAPAPTAGRDQAGL